MSESTGAPPGGTSGGKPDETQRRVKGGSERATTDVFEALVARRHRGEPCVLVTVVRTTGSTPRKQAARMLVDGRGIVGTIGGGRVEHEVIEACRALLDGDADSARPKLLRYHLTHELGMCCGGEMEVFVEPVVPEPPLLVFGAGHVARALVPVARSVGFAPIVFDEATDAGEELATPERFPEAVRIVDSFDSRDWKDLPLDERTYAVIVTRDHAVDQRLLEALIGHDLAYLGLIGSRRKIEVFKQRLVHKGFDPARFERLHAPIGLSIGAQTPEEIAVAIVAELIAVRAGRRAAVTASTSAATVATVDGDGKRASLPATSRPYARTLTGDPEK